MVKFLGLPLDIPAATTNTEAVRKSYVDTINTALSGRVTTLEGKVYWTYRGNWGSGNTYAVGDVVTWQGTTYYVKVATASGGSAPNTGSITPYQAISQGLIGKTAAYGSGTTYYPGDVVTFSNGSYLNLTGSNGTPPTAGASTTTWQLIAAPGLDGAAATVAAGSTTTAVPAASASVTNSGTTSAATLNFTIPRGSRWFTGTATPSGVDATKGTGDLFLRTDTFDVFQYTTGTGWSTAIANLKGGTGTTGTAATVNTGSTTTAVPGTVAAVANSGSTSAAVFDFTIPRGSRWFTGTATPSGTDATKGTGDFFLRTDTYDLFFYTTGTGWAAAGNIKGATGTTGATGTAATVQVGTVTSLAPGSSPTVANGGTSSAASLNFGLPRSLYPRMLWTNNTVYTVGDIIYYSNGAFMCNADHTSVSGTNAPIPGTGTTQWTPLTPKQLSYQEVVAGPHNFNGTASGLAGVAVVPHTMGFKPSSCVVSGDLTATAIIFAPYNAPAWTASSVFIRAWQVTGADYTGTIGRINLSLTPP